MSRHEVYGYEKLYMYETDLLRFEVYNLPFFLKDSRRSKTMKTAPAVCATQCLIANINIVIAVYARCFTENILQNNSKGHWEVKIISMAAE